MYPTAQRLLQHCDAVLRLPGESTGADQDVAVARERGIPVYDSVPSLLGYRRNRSPPRAARGGYRGAPGRPRRAGRADRS